MKRVMLVLTLTIGGYLAAAVAGYWLTMEFSSNVHDRMQEAVATGMLLAGPLGALVGLVTGLRTGRRRPPAL